MPDESFNLPIWMVREPDEWMGAPEWMSFHVYKEAQKCPLSVALQRSSYRQLWKGSGYPLRPNSAAITGIVVHNATETVLTRFAKANVPSLMHPTAMSVLKELGGFTKILESSLYSFFAEQANNPRFEQFSSELLRTLKQQIPKMRATLQSLLVSQVWKLSPKMGQPITPNVSPSTAKNQRFALGVGTFVEVDLQDPVAKWKGRIDIIEVKQDGCAITDLKSGTASPEHQEQLITYSMLWNHDAERNPTKRPLLKLQVVYAAGTESLPVLEGAKMQEFRNDLIASSDTVRESLNSPNVPANPSRENCRYCPVKLLCEPYWQSLPELGTDEVLSSNQVTLIEPRGERAWLATIDTSPVLTPDAKVVVRNYEAGKAFWSDMKPGLSIRLTDGLLSDSDIDEVPVINLSMMSEAVFIGSRRLQDRGIREDGADGCVHG